MGCSPMLPISDALVYWLLISDKPIVDTLAASFIDYSFNLVCTYLHFDK